MRLRSTDFQQGDSGYQQRCFHNAVLGQLGIPPQVTESSWTPTSDRHKTESEPKT